MDPARRVIEGDVLVRDGRIDAVGDVEASAATPVIDARGKVVLPGFVQGHVHLGQAMFRGLAEGLPLMDWLRRRIWPLEAAHDHASAYWSAMLGIADCLSSGTTTIGEMGLSRHMDAIFQAIEDSGIRAVAGKCLMDAAPGVPDELVDDPVDAIAQAEALIDAWHGTDDGRIVGSVCPRFILSCSEAMWRGTVELASRRGVGVHTHLLEHPDEEDEVVAALGVGQLEYFDRLGVLDTDLRVAHGVQFEARHRDILAGRPLSVIHCPSANLKLGSGIADLGFLSSIEGVRLGLGCDGAPCNNDLDVLEEMRLAALLQGVRQGPGRFEAQRALSMATIEGAASLGLGDDVGSLEPGKWADIVVLDLSGPSSFAGPGVAIYDRIVYSAARDCVDLVMVAGRILREGSRFPAIDAEQLRRRPYEEVEALLGRARLG